jgi:Mrp family chromosome partitioning ATPase
LFSAETEPGLLDLLKDPGRTFESVVMPTDVPGVSLLPLGAQDRQASELLASRRMRDLCLEVSARDRQRILIFDSSPLLLTTEAPVLASQVGQVVVVVRANHTQQQAVLAALDMLDPSKAIGCVLNQQASSSLLDGYGYYGSYGHAPTDAGKTGSNSGPGERNSATP